MMMMNIDRHIKTGCLAAMALLAASCVKDELRYPPQPTHGTLVVSTSWAEALAPGDIPATCLLSLDGGAAVQVQPGADHRHPDPLLPGTHTLLIYHEAQGFTLDGDRATVRLLADGTLEPLPAYLFSATAKAEVTAGAETLARVEMHRRLCPIVLHLSVGGDNAAAIASLSATLGGVASSVSLSAGTVGTGSHSLLMEVRPSATRPAAARSRLELHCRVVGVSPQARQQLTLTVTMDDGHTETLTSDLTEHLAHLNADLSPITLEATLHAPQDGSFSSIITDWQPGNGAGDSGSAE